MTITRRGFIGGSAAMLAATAYSVQFASEALGATVTDTNRETLRGRGIGASLRVGDLVTFSGSSGAQRYLVVAEIVGDEATCFPAA